MTVGSTSNFIFLMAIEGKELLRTRKSSLNVSFEYANTSFFDKHIAKYSNLFQYEFKVTNCFCFKKLLLFYGETAKCSNLVMLGSKL